MIALLADEDFDARIVRGLLRRANSIDMISATDADLAGSTDSVIISWAAAHGRVVVTHDVNTMIGSALEFLRVGEPMRGIIAVPQELGIGSAISDLLLIATCAEPAELEGQVWYLPL